MKPNTPDERIHNALDGTNVPPPDSETAAILRQYQEILAPLERHRAAAPPGLRTRILSQLEPHPQPRWLPSLHQWWIPALSGAAAMLLVAIGWWHWNTRTPLVNVHFELHAPGARQVELVGSFNHWQPGAIRLTGPDASGHWTATVALPEGRHEYLFLVDGQQWVTDPSATVVRPDGFGHVNAIREVTREGTML